MKRMKYEKIERRELGEWGFELLPDYLSKCATVNSEVNGGKSQVNKYFSLVLQPQ
jgi:hypothetical protein